ncbi:MAG: Dam family site-specific DNA-(adenine-N6)-methyltransferase [Chlorobium sp.]
MSNGKSFLRWAGSKKKLIPELRSYWNEGLSRYVEPFMGSATLFFAIQPTNATLSDINSELVDAFCAVRDHPRAVFNRLQLLPLGRDAYYQIRSEYTSKLPILDRAARFLYLNKYCFNGLYRTNKSGKFNVPYASSKTGQLPSLDSLYKASQIMSCADITSRDFEEALRDVHAGDFVYMDPPYAVKNARIFRQYGPDCFGIDDLSRLASSLPQIDRSGAVFLVSYALCPEAIKVFDGWHIRQVSTQRSIAGFSKHRKEAIEILVSNRELPHVL